MVSMTYDPLKTSIPNSCESFSEIIDKNDESNDWMGYIARAINACLHYKISLIWLVL